MSEDPLSHDGRQTRLRIGGRRLALSAAFLGSLVLVGSDLGLDSYGISTDEDAYHEAARRHVLWLSEGEVSRQSILEDFEYLPDVVIHPNFSRWLSGLSWLGLHRYLGVDEIVALRFHGALVFALLAAGIVGFVWTRLGSTLGWSSLLLVWSLTRLVGHAHIASPDLTLAAIWFFTTVWALRDAERSGWASGALVALGLGLAVSTKLTGVLLVLVVVAWVALTRGRRAWRWGVSILVGVPLVFAVLHPQVWVAPVEWPLSVISRFASREDNITIPTLYLGEVYLHRVPFHAPLVHALATLPPVLLVLTVVAAVRGVRSMLSSPLRSTLRSGWVLVVLAAVTPLLATCLPSVPAHDLERLFLPLQPLLVPVACVGLGALLASGPAARALERLPERSRAAARTACLTVLLAPGAIETIAEHPFELTYFSSFVGGEKGAESLGLDVAYSKAEANGRLLAALERLVPPGSRVYAHFVGFDLRAHQRRGRLSSAFSIVRQPPFDWVVLYGRRGWMNAFERKVYEEVAPVWSIDHRGVRLVAIYRVSTTDGDEKDPNATAPR